jgi:hypothetical protein
MNNILIAIQQYYIVSGLIDLNTHSKSLLENVGLDSF